MKEPEEKKESKFTQVALIASAILIVALVGLVWWLRGRAEMMKTRLADSKTQYEAMKLMKSKILDLRSRGASDQGPQDVTEAAIMTFLSKKAREKGLPDPELRPTTPQKSGGWNEIAVTVQLGSQGQATNVPRGPLIDFLAAVEQERPYLKSKKLQMSFAGASPQDPQRATVVISFFKRE